MISSTNYTRKSVLSFTDSETNTDMRDFDEYILSGDEVQRLSYVVHMC